MDPHLDGIKPGHCGLQYTCEVKTLQGKLYPEYKLRTAASAQQAYYKRNHQKAKMLYV